MFHYHTGVGFGVSACFVTGDAAQALGPAIMTVFIVFGGYYANASNVPRGLRWIAHTSLIKYAFEAFCVNEFRGLNFANDKPGRTGSESGEEVRTSLISLLYCCSNGQMVMIGPMTLKQINE